MKTGQVKRELSRLADEERVRERTLTDECHVDRAAALAAGACRVAARRRGMSFPAFVARQVRYTGRHVWVWQGAAACFDPVGLSSGGCAAGHPGPGIRPVLLQAAAPAPVRRGHPVGLELRALLCTQRSTVPLLCQIRHLADGGGGGGVRVLAPAADGRSSSSQGGSAVLMELGVTAAACLLWDVDVGSLAAWLFLPFLLAWDLILFLLDRGRGRHFAVRSSAVLGGGISPLCLCVEVCEPGSGRGRRIIQ